MNDNAYQRIVLPAVNACSCLFLQAETFVWVNSSSSHAQSVAKAKYQFLFGKGDETSSTESGMTPFI